MNLFVFSCDDYHSENINSNYFINGQSKNTTDGTNVYLKVQESNKIIPLDTTQIINNTFQFKGKVDRPEIYGIYIDSLEGSIGLFMENDSISIAVNKNNLNESKIYGSNTNDQYLNFVKKSNTIISETKSLFPLFQKARSENDIEKLTKINNKIEEIYKENLMFTLQFARDNPDSYVAAFALQSLLKEKSVHKDTIAAIYNNFSHEVKKGDFSIEILLYLENQESVKN